MDLPASLLNTAQVAAWLGVSPRTVCLWAECSELPAIRVGRQWRFQREAILQWLAVRKDISRRQEKISVDAATAAYKLPTPTVQKGNKSKARSLEGDRLITRIP